MERGSREVISISQTSTGPNRSLGLSQGPNTVFVRLRSIHSDELGPGLFFYQCALLFCNTIACLFLLFLVLILPIVMIYYGAMNFNDCPVQPYLPIYLIVGGAMGVVKILLFILRRAFPDSCLNNVMTNKILLTITSSFMLLWFIMGNVWVFDVFMPNIYDTTSEYYCNDKVYIIAFVVIIASHSFLLTLFCCTIIIYYLVRLDVQQEQRIQEQVLSNI